MIDESHMTMGQVKGMYNGDRARKEMLCNYGFRLPSALDNRPLKREEFESHVHQIVYVSATPGDYEMEQTDTIVEQIIRPTGRALSPLYIPFTCPIVMCDSSIIIMKSSGKKSSKVYGGSPSSRPSI